MIQEFEISITAVGGDQYLVRTENVAKGVPLAEEKVRWSVSEWLEQTKALMHDPLLGLLKGQQRHALTTRTGRQPSQHSALTDAEAATLIHLGQTLHDELFQGQLHDSWVTAQGVAQNRQDLLRLRIGMKDSRLQQLPWETLHAGTRPLATGTDVIFSRYILDRRQAHSLPLTRASEPGQSLRILMVIAAPDDQERLELKQEVYHLQSELHPDLLVKHADTGETLLDVQLTILEQPGRAELTQELDRGNYQVLHYAGHSNLGNAGGDLYLVSRQTGLTEPLSGEDLAGLLVNNGIKLAVFNSCRGGYSSSSEPGWQERNLAQALVNRGLPAVIAMTERIPDHVAITFTQLLYRNLRKGQSIDLSLNRTRQGLISAYGSHEFYWALPTLYMQPSFDGYLVRTTNSTENAQALDNDLFGDLFFESELADTDAADRRTSQATDAALAGSETAASAPQPLLPNDSSAVRADVSPEASSDNQKVSYPVRSSADADATNALLKQLSMPLSTADTSTADIDDELHVPEAVETPSGFYGEQQTAVPVPPEIADPTTEAVPAERVGKRLPRRRTPQPRKFSQKQLLIVSGIAGVALVGWLGVVTAGWLQRDRLTPDLLPTSVSELELPAQLEIALNQKDLDAATIATQKLIDQGKFTAAINALNTANRSQQTDVIVSFFKGRAQWGLVKQGSNDFSVNDAMRSWVTALAGEPDWMEISMALGFAQYAMGDDDLALESWQRAIVLAERQPAAENIYFSDQPASEYVLNAYAGVAMAALSLSKIEADPVQRNLLTEQALAAFVQVLNEAPDEFRANSLGDNWLWLGSAIADWSETKEELSLLLIE
ncbi:CHAT domain-containing protein [Leptolyngbya sp. BC1307]|uniref:CHAT domain-containing protein n=1 Tax=Leptolyngbya sp. BC1307 TaxID=2029589 RepID=UPI000EFC4E63|nr:CHAT domain-containing protein [Leptolyngbya sp. BC1307]